MCPGLAERGQHGAESTLDQIWIKLERKGITPSSKTNFELVKQTIKGLRASRFVCARLYLH